MRRGALLVLLLVIGACSSDVASDSAASAATRDRQDFATIERGRYLAVVGDCAACHTEAGGKPYAGGRAIETPFGNLLASNLTPDRDTGIGAWSDDDFVSAVQRGRSRGGVRLYPAMPYNYYTKMTRADVLAIRAYLGTLEPVHHQVTSNQLPFPFSIRASMAVWNALFFTPGTFKPVADKPAEWNAGAYLVEGAGHCGACHTAKNFLGGDKTSHALEGGVLQGWYSPNLTGDKRAGLGSWSPEEIVAYLKSGHNAAAAATGPMSEVVTDSTSQMTDGDLRAIAAFLKDQPATTAEPGAIAATDPAMRTGEAIYADNCAACHAMSGDGVARLFPALKGSPSTQSADPTSLIRVVLQGARSVATASAPTGPAMPAFDWKLSDAQVAAVLTYIRNSWGNAAAAVSAGEVRRSRGKLASQ
ncbi:MAG TPA: cytochrome c [Stellaceae bacterium]|nr:cytochrome c [Stellaceae bacterium]